jgi:hypothetical protein
MIMFSAFGFIGQHVANFLDARETKVDYSEQTPKDDRGIWQRLAESKWTPVTFISNDDYAKILSEKLISVETEISVLEEEIQKLRNQQEQTKK